MLDIRTIYITTFLVYICMTGILWVIWNYYSRGYQGVGLWVLGMTSGIVAFPLIAMRGFIPMPLSVVAGITLLPSGLACIIVGLERFFQIRPFVRLQIFFVLATFAWQCCFLLVQDDVYVRIAGFSSICAVQVFWAAYRLLFEISPGYRPMARFTAVIFLLLGGMFTERVFYSLSYAGRADLALAVDPTRSAPLYFLLILSVLLVFSFLVMLFRRQTMALEQKTRELEKYQNSLENTVREQSARLIETEKIASIGILAAGVGHEISNPNQVIAHNLASVDKFLDLTAPSLEKDHSVPGTDRCGPSGDLFWKVRKGIIQAREACSRISRIINDLRDFSQPDEETSPAIHDLRDSIRSGVGFCRQYMSRRTCNFELELPEYRLDYFCRSHSIEQVVINLLKNAADSLTSQQDSITLDAWKTDKGLFIRVRDTGRGIDPEKLSNVTSPFYTTKREAGGTGLGLYMAARIVEEYQGRLDIQSEPGQGTRAQIFLPDNAKDGASDSDH